jgi:hypothetical protein
VKEMFRGGQKAHEKIWHMRVKVKIEVGVGREAVKTCSVARF